MASATAVKSRSMLLQIELMKSPVVLGSVGRCCAIAVTGFATDFGGVGSESRPLGGGPYENHFALSANSGWVYRAAEALATSLRGFGHGEL